MTATAKRCPACNQVIPSRRSVEISTRFQGWITWMTRKLNGQKSREEVYMLVLLKACELETSDGAAPYPYTIVNDVLYPHRTTNRSNRAMMQACWACEVMAFEWEIGPLPESLLPQEGEPMICAVYTPGPGDPCWAPVSNHEVCSRGSGGPKVEWNQIALCRKHHTIAHTLGWPRFCERYPRVAGKVLAARNRMGRRTESVVERDE